ncbi:OmpA family protein [Paraburkholderia pallida]|uniref:OmpA family protein n=2 Tax=Paraburkholderia pallida TaxID=2547399 RepID=A0A4P7CWW9_9BURK|nr:OmpA family protein [Paraburkholderia pallida]QBR00709.1 OmpA family protein [Paraburkholderia pallida]
MFSVPAFADDASPARVTPVDTSGGQIRTTELPGTASAAGQVSQAGTGNASASASGTRGTVSSTPAPANTAPGQVVVGGKVPDEATHAAVLQRLRDTYGAANVVDQIEVGDVATPPNWSANVQKLINPGLKQIRKGQLKIDGTQIDVRGEVGNEAQRQQIASDMANALNPTYTIRNGLRVSASEQGLLDQTLANRTIEFETGSATLAPEGRAILDQMAAVLVKMNTRTVEIIGHTDNSGNRASNIALSQARADAVKGYLVGKGISPQQLTTDGVGPDQPVASNDTADGRARNRRIEFRAGL